MAEPRAPRESLTEILKIESRGVAAYAARLESFWGATACGDLLARATLAATADGREPPAAVHASFLADAPPEVELSLMREDLGPDRTRVRVLDSEQELICDVTLRFGPVGAGLSYQCIAPEAALPAPEELPSEVEVARAEGWSQFAVGPIESRRIGRQDPVKDDEPAEWIGWLRPREALPDQARLHAAALAFLGEYRSHWAVERRLGAAFPQSRVTLLDHALWVHRAERWDDWWLVKTLTDVGVAGRCFSRREIYTRRGSLIASAAWEAAVRPRAAA
jgi:acyl-CoA thioesterase-2